jgi:secreted PhoX family phosphatase
MQPDTMEAAMEVTRRRFLVFLGATSSAVALDVPLARLTSTAWANGAPKSLNRGNPGGGILTGDVTPVRLPFQLHAYGEGPSFLPASGSAGNVGDFANAQLNYTVFDDVVVPPEYERYVILSWGDRVYADPDEYFGYNADYTAFVPRRQGDTDDGWLWVNHEYVSSPMSFAAPEAPASLASAVPQVRASALAVIGIDLDAPGTSQLLRWGEFSYNMGGSVVRIAKRESGRFEPIADECNRRYHLLSGLGLNADRTDARADGTGYRTVTSWGAQGYQQGDLNYAIGTGAAASDVFPSSTDGLGEKIIGIGFNCSGGYTPWGTILTCEENFQASPGAFFVGVQENIDADGHQTGYAIGTPATTTDVRSGQTFLNYTTGAYFGQVGEKYGYVVEIDPRDPDFRARKHTALGRFRHENIALRAEKGQHLVAYMGDDRRGGHTWKYVSDGTVKNANRRDDNSALFESGTLHVAKFNADGTGSWIPFRLDAVVDPQKPSDLGSAEATGRGVAITAVTNARLKLPKRTGVAAQTANGGPFDVLVANEATAVPDFKTKGGTVPAGATLGDYYSSLGAALVDAFLAANLIGGTPCARPEDFEVLDGKVFLAFTDGAPGSDGYPDSRIFTVGKYQAAVDFEQPSGGVYRLTEDSWDGSGLTFTWERFDQGGEVGANNGAGFAAIDNLVFDDDRNLWGVIDMTTAAHNGFNLTYTGPTLQPGLTTISHAETGNFGNVFGV